MKEKEMREQTDEKKSSVTRRLENRFLVASQAWISPEEPTEGPPQTRKLTLKRERWTCKRSTVSDRGFEHYKC
jgi:hypothetical protein